MRRYLTLVFMVCLAIPAGMTFSGCVRNPAGNYCNGLGYGLKDTDVFAIDLEPKTTGVSMAFGQTRQINAPTATTCKGASANVSSYSYATTNNQLLDISTTGNMCAGTWNRNSGGGIPDFTICNPPSPLPNSGGLPYSTTFISASANSVTSNPVEVYVHAQVSSVTLATSGTAAGAQQCYSQGVSAQLDSEACFASGGQQYEFCAPATESPANYACALPSGVTSVPSCSNSIGALTYTVGTASVATLNNATNVITAAQPGTTAITASVAGSGSSAGYFSTCPPKSISVTLNGATTATVTQGITQNLLTTVLDTNNQPITGLTLQYQSTNPLDISVGGAGSIVPSFPGATSVYVVCEPSTCNPSPINQVGLFGTGLSISSNAVNITTPGTASSYVWFSAPGQSQYFVPYDLVGNTLGSTVRLPYVPNSMVMDQLGSTLYFGSSHALMTFSTLNDAMAGTPNTSVPGIVLAVAPNDHQVLINDQVRNVFYIYNTSGSVAATFAGVGSSAAWTPDSQTLYVSDSASLGSNHSDTLYVYNANTGWTTYDLTASGGATNLALTIPGVGAYLSGNPTVAHTWCPSGTSSNYSSLVFYPQGDSVATQTDTLAATTDGQHILGAAMVGGAVQLSDISVSIPFVTSSGAATGGSSQVVNLPIACPQSGQTLEPLTIQHPFPTSQQAISGITATAVTQIVPSPASNLAFLTYTGSTPGAKLPYYMPGANGAAGTVNYVTLTGGNAVTAPVAGAFSLDDKLFFVSTAGDNLIHFVNTTTLQDTQQINPNLPACTPGSDPDCLITTPTTNSVPTTAIAVKPRSTT
jgi:trimeric autotransporter adhesin